ncbi:Short-chain dehydrogenase [Agromyces sp. CF514]|uniref:SDR family oxidoreductase n=1 Tax=Agromyces sp. CF514 TaxID=1881031 RepID=UPI0008EFF4E8|nr:SDR family oxidoreductase [Agromyces sp. CF514]SFR71490.1 Short-chain dehydrogenase [Agromyces sp. CF514]
MTLIDGSTLLITGANGGLGTEFVRQALDRGAQRVYAAARTPKDWADARVVPLALDVTDAAAVASLADLAPDVSIVVNNAGISLPGPTLAAPMDGVRAIFETNVFGPLAIVQQLAPVLAANGGGAVIDVHSALSWHAGGNVYSATKAALWSLTNSLRLELAGQGTQVLGAHLGYTDTPMTAGLDVPKERPADIVAAIYDGLEAGDHEVLADQTSRALKAALSAPLEQLYPELRAQGASRAG